MWSRAVKHCWKKLHNYVSLKFIITNLKLSSCDASILGWEVPLEKGQLTPEFLGFPGGSDGRESACNAADLGLIAGLGRSPGGGHGHPLQYSYLENPMDRGQRSLMGYSPWVCKESDLTEQLRTSTVSNGPKRLTFF